MILTREELRPEFHKWIDLLINKLPEEGLDNLMFKQLLEDIESHKGGYLTYKDSCDG